jgi:hypothetical protein
MYRSGGAVREFGRRRWRADGVETGFGNLVARQDVRGDSRGGRCVDYRTVLAT